MKRYTFTLNLKNNPVLIKEYISYHKNVWPEIEESIKQSGIERMEIYVHDTRLFMIMDVNETFSFEKKSAMDAANVKVQEWENLMWKYQDPVEGADDGEKWVLMEEIYKYG